MAYTEEQLLAALRKAKASGDDEAVQVIQSELALPRNPDALQQEWDQQPWYGKAGTATADDLRMLAKGATLGYAPNIVAGLHSLLPGSDDYSTILAQEQGRQAEAAQRSGLAGTAAEIIGGVAPATKAMQLGAMPFRAAGSLVEGMNLPGIPAIIKRALPGVVSTAATTGEGAIGGGIVGGAKAGAQGDNIPRGILQGATEGAVISPAAKVASKVIAPVFGKAAIGNAAREMGPLGNISPEAADRVAGMLAETGQQATQNAGRMAHDIITGTGVTAAEALKNRKRQFRAD